MHRTIVFKVSREWAKIGGSVHRHGRYLRQNGPGSVTTSNCQKRPLSVCMKLHTEQDGSKSDIADTKIHTDDSSKNIQDLIRNAKLPTDGTERPPEFISDMETARNNRRRDQKRGSFRPRVDPGETSVLLFPGQGSQFVGMGKNLLSIPKVREIYSTANKILGYDLLDLCLNGPKEELDKTVHCQPAVFVTSLAAVEKLKEESEMAIANCTTAVGFSVGEFAALVFAGSLSFEDALQVVHKRAKAMQMASEEIPSGMMTAFLGPDNKAKMAAHTAALYCRRELGMDPESVDCIIANFLYPECKVFAGNIEALEFIEKHSRDFGIRRTKHLPVSGAFHSKLMLPAVESVRDALAYVKISRPIISVHSNIDSERYTTERNMAKMLAKQVISPVKWEQIMHKIYERKKDIPYPKTYEVGPGRQLGAMLKMNNNKAYLEYRPVDV